MPHAPKITRRQSALSDDQRIANLRVLIADPYAQLREIMRDILLRGIGVEEVVEAKNGEEALALLRDVACERGDCRLRHAPGGRR